jgi:hypothetical protein
MVGDAILDVDEHDVTAAAHSLSQRRQEKQPGRQLFVTRSEVGNPVVGRAGLCEVHL